MYQFEYCNSFKMSGLGFSLLLDTFARKFFLKPSLTSQILKNSIPHLSLLFKTLCNGFQRKSPLAFQSSSADTPFTSPSELLSVSSLGLMFLSSTLLSLARLAFTLSTLVEIILLFQVPTQILL